MRVGATFVPPMATSLIEELATPRGRRRSRDSARGKLSAVQLEESASKLSFLVFRPGSVNSPHRIARQAEKRGDITGSLKCPGIKTTTEDGGHFCGIRRRESFSDEQDAVGVSIVST